MDIVYHQQQNKASFSMEGTSSFGTIGDYFFYDTMRKRVVK